MTVRSRRLLAALAVATLPAAALLAAPPATAQTRIEPLGLDVTVTPTVATDYLFRGISQTRNRGAVQLTVDASHESGLYIAGFLSNVNFVGTNARQELDGLAGYRFEALGFKWDLGGIYYGYPGYDRAPGAYNLHFFEAALRASREFGPVTALAALHGSPNFFSQSGTGIYVEGGLDAKLPLFELSASARVAYQWIERNERFGTPDYLWYSIGLGRDLPGGFSLAVGYYGNSLSRNDCVGGLKECDNRFLASVSRKF